MKWFKANINGTGFYRVGYPRENWDSLIHQLVKDHKVFSVADRAQLINDAFSLSMYENSAPIFSNFVHIFYTIDSSDILNFLENFCTYYHKREKNTGTFFATTDKLLPNFYAWYFTGLTFK